VPKIIISDTINLFFNCNQHYANFKPFRVRFDKTASVYLLEKYIYLLALEMASPGKQHCANCIGTLSYPTESLALLGLHEFELLSRVCVDVHLQLNGISLVVHLYYRSLLLSNKSKTTRSSQTV